MKTILVPIDLSTSTASVCAAAVSFARTFGGNLVFLHVVQPPVITSDYGIAVENLEELVTVSEKSASVQLENLKKQYEAADMSVETLQMTGAPAPIILEEARKRAVDYIVMGSHGHTALYDLLVGTTTHGVLKRARCPVLIIPSPERPQRR